MNKNKMIRIFKYSGTILCLIIFIFLATLIYFNKLEPLAVDIFFRDLAYNIRGEKNGFGYWFFRIITEFGNVFLVGLIIFFIGIFTKMDFRFFLTVIGIMGALLLNVGMKEIYSRERPIEEMRWVIENSSSFPSGHATAAGFLYIFIFYMTFHSKMNQKLKIITYSFCSIIIPLVMISRLILGVHYFTDVIAGFSSGVMVACICMLLYRYCLNYNILTSSVVRKKNKEQE